MKRKRFAEEQIIGILKEAEQTGNIREVCRLHNLTEQTFYRWRNKFGAIHDSCWSLHYLSIKINSLDQAVRFVSTSR